jgi:putative hemolysin
MRDAGYEGGSNLRKGLGLPYSGFLYLSAFVIEIRYTGHRHSVKRESETFRNPERTWWAHLGLSLLHRTYATINSGFKAFRASIRAHVNGFSFPRKEGKELVRMSEIGIDVLFIGLLILANGVFTMSEVAVVAARKSRLQEWASKGNRKAKTALELVNKPNRLLLTAQIGITLVGILAGTFGTRAFAEPLSTIIASITAIEPYGQAIALGLVVLGLTYLLLVVGELVPKRLAMRYPDTIAAVLALPLCWFSKMLSPLASLLTISTDVVCRLFGKTQAQEPAVTEEEIKTLVQQGTEAGVFEESEQDMVEAVLRLGDKTARSLITPRTKIAWIDLGDSIEQIREKIVQSGHSRFPVATETLDNVTGIVQAKDLLAMSLAGKSLDLKALIQQPLFVPRTISVLALLESFKKSSKHIALVVDEYGGIEGLLTHHDILEAIAGDMPFGARPSDPKAVQRQDGSWLLDGMLSVDEFKEIFHLESLPGEKKDAYQTLGGFVFTQMGRVPSVAEHFEWNDFRFEVVDMDGKRIDKVLVTSIAKVTTEPAVKSELARQD